MMQLRILIILSFLSIILNGYAYAKSFAEYESDLGQIIDPALEYLDCNDDDWYVKPLCAYVAGEVGKKLEAEGIAVNKNGIIYSTTNFAPHVKVTDGCSTISVEESFLSGVISRDTSFKFGFESITTPLFFAASIPTDIYAKVNLDEKIRTRYDKPFPLSGYECADPSFDDHFYMDALLTSNTNVLVAFSLETRVLPRATPYEDFKIEIAPKVYVDGYIKDLDFNYSIHNKNWIADTLARFLSLPTTLASAAKNLYLFDFNGLKADLIEFTVNGYVYPIIPNALYLTDDLATNFIKRRINNEYSKGLGFLEEKLNSEIARALNLNSDGRYIFSIDPNMLELIPSAIKVPSISDSSYIISWAPSTISGVTYHLEEATNISFTSGLRTVVSGTTALSAPITGRNHGVTYYYRVRAEKSGLVSDWVNGANGCTLGQCIYQFPQTPNYYIDDYDYEDEFGTNNTYFNVVWDGSFIFGGIPVSNTDSYGRPYWESGGYRYTKGSWINFDGFWDTTAWQVCRTTAGTMLPAPPSNPSSIAVPAISTTGSYTVSWGASATEGVTYHLEEAVNNSFNSGLRVVASGTTALSASISGRKTGVTYYYRVRAEKGGPTSEYRAAGNGCLITDAVSAPVGIMVPNASTEGSYTVSWTPSPTNGVTYHLQEATNSSFTAGLRTVVSGTTALSASITDRLVGVSYYYRVRADLGETASVWRIGGNSCTTFVLTNCVSLYSGPMISSFSGTISNLRPIEIQTNFSTNTFSSSYGQDVYDDVDVTVNGTSLQVHDAWGDEITSILACYAESNPFKPNSITVPASTSTDRFTISWTASPTNGVYYRLEEATNASFTSGVRTVIVTSALSATVASTPGVTYYYRIRAEKNGLYSDWVAGNNGCAVSASNCVTLYSGALRSYYSGTISSARPVTINFDVFSKIFYTSSGSYDDADARITVNGTSLVVEDPWGEISFVEACY